MDIPLPLPQMEFLFLSSMGGGGQTAWLNLDFPTPMPLCQGSPGAAPHVPFSVWSLPRCVLTSVSWRCSSSTLDLASFSWSS